MNKMADSSDENLVPELRENADHILFVKDLFNYLELRDPNYYDEEWKPEPFREYIYNAFNPTVTNALSFFDFSLEMCYYNIFSQMQSANSVNSYTYERFAENLAAEFPKKFNAKYILIYCSILCRMSVYFSRHKVLDAIVLARKYILKFLQKYNILKDQWSSIHKDSEFYEKALQYAANESCFVSDEIKRRFRPQNKVNYESNSSGSEDQDISTENKEINLQVQQGKSNEKPFLKESIPRYFESRCEAGSSFSRRSESLYTVMVDDCKNKMIRAWDSIKIVNQPRSERNELIDKSVPDNRLDAYQESAQISIIDQKRYMAMSLFETRSKISKALSLKENTLLNKSTSNDMICRGTSNTCKKSSSMSIKHCKKNLSFSSDLENDADYQLRSFDGSNVVNKSESKKNFVSKAPSPEQLSVSSRRKLEFSVNNEKVENIPLSHERPPILRYILSNTGLKRVSPSSSDHEKEQSEEEENSISSRRKLEFSFNNENSFSSRRKLEFSFNNENAENIPLTDERSPILRHLLSNTGLKRVGLSSSDHEKSSSDKDKSK